MTSQIGEVQSVNTKLPVVDDITKISAVCPVMLPLISVPVDTLVYPIPDKPPL